MGNSGGEGRHYGTSGRRKDMPEGGTTDGVLRMVGSTDEAHKLI